MTGALLAFTGAATLLVLSPGPATLLVVQTAARSGRRAAYGAMSGNAMGLVLWAFASILGIAALVSASAVAHDLLRLAGAVVLIVLGAQAIRRAGRRSRGAAPVARGGRSRTAFASGFLTALTNPKAAIFYIALLPQFVPSGGFVPGWTAAFAAIQICLMLAWYSALTAAVGRAARILRRPAVLDWVERTIGAGFVALGALLVVEAR